MKNWRANIIFFLIILFSATIIGRLFYLQIIQYDYYKALAQGQQKDFQFLKGERGEIFFSGGQILATNIKGKYVFVSPQKIKDTDSVVKKLSKILNLEEELILKIIQKDSLFETVKSSLTEEEENDLLKLNLDGVYLGQTVFRKYPQGPIASQTIGFLGGNDMGQYGIEGYYDEILQGKERFQKGEKGFIGYFFDDVNKGTADGSDIYLTLDYNIQFIAEKLLEEAKKNLDIEGGLIIVSDPNSGKILALANFPNFDPNLYSKVKDFQIFQNEAIQRFFEPGSVFKAITMAAALDQEKITPQTTYVDEGYVKIGGHIIYNYGQKVWGKKTITEVLENSINTGAVFAEKQLGHNLFLKYIEQFGFFQSTGIDLQGEVFSENKEFKKGYEINFATVSFGQGIEITPIQLVRAFSAIANGGKLVRPYIVEKVFKNNKMVETKPKISEEQIISPKTVSQLTAMLVSVIENGLGKRARIPGYYVAGKTGTSQVPWSSLGINTKGYSDKTWQSFIGFTPAFNAKFVILVKLNNPKTKDASSSALPIFRELAKYIIDYFEIPPDHETE